MEQAASVADKFARQIDGVIEEVQIKLPRDFACAELFQVRRQPLRVEQGKAPLAQVVDQCPERDLRGSGSAMKHRLAEKRAADSDPVKAADKFVTLPSLDRVGVTKLMQTRVALDNFVVDPGVGPLCARAEDGLERSVDPDFDRARAARVSGRAAHGKSRAARSCAARGKTI